MARLFCLQRPRPLTSVPAPSNGGGIDRRYRGLKAHLHARITGPPIGTSTRSQMVIAIVCFAALLGWRSSDVRGGSEQTRDEFPPPSHFQLPTYLHPSTTISLPAALSSPASSRLVANRPVSFDLRSIPYALTAVAHRAAYLPVSLHFCAAS